VAQWWVPLLRRSSVFGFRKASICAHNSISMQLVTVVRAICWRSHCCRDLARVKIRSLPFPSSCLLAIIGSASGAHNFIHVGHSWMPRPTILGFCQYYTQTPKQVIAKKKRSSDGSTNFRPCGRRSRRETQRHGGAPKLIRTERAHQAWI
jgi:hypothetical protein